LAYPYPSSPSPCPSWGSSSGSSSSLDSSWRPRCPGEVSSVMGVAIIGIVERAYGYVMSRQVLDGVEF
jgi:hypothetical protein